MTDFSTTLTGLEYGKSYLVKVRTVNSLNVPGEWSDTIVVSPGNGAPGTEGGQPPPPDNLSVKAGLKSIIVSFDRPQSPYRRWELYVTNKQGSIPSISPLGSDLVEAPVEAQAVGRYTPQFAGANYYGSTTDTIHTVSLYCDELYDGLWKPLTAETDYYVGIVGVSPTGIRSDIIWATTRTGSIENSDIAADSITADRLTASELKANISLSGKFITSESANGMHVEISSQGITAWGQDVNNVPKVVFELNTLSGTAAFSGAIDVGGSDSSSFHVDTSGRIWSGSNSFTTAKFSVDSVGNVIMRNAADLYVRDTGTVTVGTVQSGNDFLRLQQLSGSGFTDQGALTFYSDAIGTPIKAYLSYDYTGATSVLRIGNPDDDTLDHLYLGHNLKNGHTSSATYLFVSSIDSNAFRFTDHGVNVMTIGKDGSNNTEITFPSQLASGSGTAVVVASGSPYQLLKQSSSIRYKYNISPLINEIDIEYRLTSMEPVAFTYKTGSNRIYGLIAEQLDAVDHNLVLRNDNGEPEDIVRDSVLGLLVAGYQDLLERIRQLEGF